MSKKSEPATKDDVREIVSEVVGEVASEILTVMAEKFEQVDARFEQVDARFDQLEGRMNRMENMLRPTIDTVDEHEAIIKRWKMKAA